MFLSDLVTQCFLTFSDTWSTTNLKKQQQAISHAKGFAKPLLGGSSAGFGAQVFFFSVQSFCCCALNVLQVFSVFLIPSGQPSLNIEGLSYICAVLIGDVFPQHPRCSLAALNF